MKELENGIGNAAEMIEEELSERRKLDRMRLYLACYVFVILFVAQIRSNHIISHRLSLFIQRHWYNNISQIYRLNDCKYSKVRIDAAKKVFIIISKTHWCNEGIKAVFGVSAETRRNGSNVIAWAMPYNYTGSIDPRSRCRNDAYFENASRTAYGLARIDLLCRKRQPRFARLVRRIWKRSVQEKHHPFTVTIYGINESLFTITIGVLLYAVFGACFLVTNLAYLSGICTVQNATLIPENEKNEIPKDKVLQP
ncbi:unnamed protein product [Cercopithifilaria johnstoni]|uniref:Uncharacterized protein n=1 Tax=Cercopithifilaria johnstoni TaxID=2874296 RepID=A0A8J2LNI0_9BILA|nr:unnamed protein product [Cercopithifilaria johnstoni]